MGGNFIFSYIFSIFALEKEDKYAILGRMSRLADNAALLQTRGKQRQTMLPSPKNRTHRKQANGLFLLHNL